MPRRLDDWLKTYMQYTAASESPDKFHFFTGVSVLAGALRRCVWLDLGYFTWTPNFYIIFVAPPGIVSKSTTADIGARLLREVPDVHFGPDAVTWQRLVQAFAQANEQIEHTDESGEPYYLPQSAMTIVSSEFGNLLNPADKDMVDLLVSLWDTRTGTWTKSTKTQGDDVIENPWINIVACTTPGWIAGNFPEYMIGGGFTSRCIWVYGDEKRNLVSYPHRVLPSGFDQLADDLVHDLEHISKLRGSFRLTEDAYAWGEIWYRHNYEHNIKQGADERMQGYYARKQTHLHKLAMVLSAARDDNLIITPDHLEMANEILSAQETDIPKVFSKIGLTQETQAINQLLHLVRQKPGLSPWDHYGPHFARFLTQDRFREVFKSLLQSGFVRIESNGLHITNRGLDYVKSEAEDPEVFDRVLSS